MLSSVFMNFVIAVLPHFPKQGAAQRTDGTEERRTGLGHDPYRTRAQQRADGDAQQAETHRQDTTGNGCEQQPNAAAESRHARDHCGKARERNAAQPADDAHYAAEQAADEAIQMGQVRMSRMTQSVRLEAERPPFSRCAPSWG